MKIPTILAALVVLAGCASPPEVEKRSLTMAESLDVASLSAASCTRGTTRGGRSFILCKNGVTSLSAFKTALRGPVDRSLSLQSVERQYALAPKTFTGIRAATYSDLVLRDRQPVPTDTRTFDTVTVDGAIFDVYRFGRDGREATIFVQRA